MHFCSGYLNCCTSGEEDSKHSSALVINKAVVGGPASPAMAGLVFGNGIKLTSSIKSINFQIYSFCSFVDFEINSARLEFILSWFFDCGIAV